MRSQRVTSRRLLGTRCVWTAAFRGGHYTYSLNSVACVAAGLPQVTVANAEEPHFGPSDRPTRLPRGGDRRLLQRLVDPPHDHLFRPYVPQSLALTDDASSIAGAASFTIYTRTKEFFRDHHLVDHTKLLGCSVVGGIGGAMAGSLISFGSAREFPCNPRHSLVSLSRCRLAFELVKVLRHFRRYISLPTTD